MSDIVIVSAVRTPVGSFNGALATLPAHELGKLVIQAAIERAHIAPGDVDEVIMGQVLQAGAGGVVPSGGTMVVGMFAVTAAWVAKLVISAVQTPERPTMAMVWPVPVIPLVTLLRL